MSTHLDFPTYVYATEVPVVIDGDTVRVNIDMGFRCWTRQTVRLGGINAPELSTHEGIVARAALIAWVLGFTTGTWHVQTYLNGEDKYGRYLATVFAPDGTRMNTWMIENSYARSWDGKGEKPA